MYKLLIDFNKLQLFERKLLSDNGLSWSSKCKNLTIKSLRINEEILRKETRPYFSVSYFGIMKALLEFGRSSRLLSDLVNLLTRSFDLLDIKSF